MRPRLRASVIVRARAHTHENEPRPKLDRVDDERERSLTLIVCASYHAVEVTIAAAVVLEAKPKIV